jgi:hypothetical protein
MSLRRRPFFAELNKFAEEMREFEKSAIPANNPDQVPLEDLKYDFVIEEKRILDLEKLYLLDQFLRHQNDAAKAYLNVLYETTNILWPRNFLPRWISALQRSVTRARFQEYASQTQVLHLTSQH